MYRILKNKQKGFTLIELMIVVAIIGILAAVAIPQFLKMMSKSKTGEAQLSLDLMKKANKAQWAETTGFIDSTAAPTVPSPTTGTGTDCCNGPNKKCPVNEADWENATWAALDFKIDQPNFFVYTYVGGGTPSTMTATASGDLNCNGTPGVYTLAGEVDGAGGPVFTLTKPPANEN